MTAQKADFNDVYSQPDPRAYYETLGALDYEIPVHGCQVFDAVLGELRSERETPLVVDLCCSYGINAALLNHEVTMEELKAHYRTAGERPRDELIERDRKFFAERITTNAVDIVGVDISQAAIDYAVEAGLLVDGVVADLENVELGDDDAARLAHADLVTITGGVGYVMDRTFDQILGAADRTPWVAALSLRWIDFDPIAEALDSHGLVTEKLDGYVVPQRRFADEGEAQYVIGQLESQGIEPTAVERSGRHGAELYLARPAADAAGHPIDTLLGSLV